MYVIIIGAGRTGNTVIDLATRDDHEVVVIERETELAEAVSTTYDCLVLNADAASKEILLEAGIEEADALISTTESDSVNLMITMFGKQYGVETLVSSINDPAHMELFEDLGVSIVESPHRLNGQYLYRAVQHPAIQDFMPIAGGAEIFEATVDAGAPIDGRSLIDADRDGLLPEETIIVAIVRDDDLVIPQGETEIRADDVVTIFARNGATNRVTNAFTGP
ncbi:TrkA-N domain protein [Natrinema pellirubrum DSM 15624]|uniref:K+ transport system, NAD-binding component n=1 Tax=Natrinema pellirubrum (strain DSM 15624 / CIP 106293 / JCM 10476 / NCIMB 786 / 157) TaxID=797303 RepID=L0JJM8_NATP1|nr:TrkA family potassium uptake protein [Natrinema pellirubrum]AGB30556.1 K+ transport system, NAD-binding component [Natrinema pellirubrum DSM 15624]ELY77026.1 TrkA-N domain protein [Natrinema pellirubrum DSM 15624]